ncbi:MAG: hypothetical protein R3C58_08995 [Parvularculaceae bacterium]
MNAYAQNPGGFASLTSSLLARKGEAMPAVDAEAHEGVDIDMRPLQPANSPGAPKEISEEAISKLYEKSAAAAERPQRRRQRSVRLVHPAPAAEIEPPVRPAPEVWTLRSRKEDARKEDLRASARIAPGPRLIEAKPADIDDSSPEAASRAAFFARRAIVTLRMPARDLVRLRLASRELDMSCQAIILDALGCYLDANDVPGADDDAQIREETERMLSRSKKKK